MVMGVCGLWGIDIHYPQIIILLLNSWLYFIFEKQKNKKIKKFNSYREYLP